jgi:hypothetical protein
MSQFYVLEADSAERCKRSARYRWDITVSGVDPSDDLVKVFFGEVQSVQDMGEDKPAARRWLVTMPAAVIKEIPAFPD